MDVIKKIKEVIESSPAADDIDSFLSDLKDSLASSNKQFITLSFLFPFTLLLYHLLVHEGWKEVEMSGLKISNSQLFEKVFLVVPAGVFIMLTAIGYLRKLQREIYDKLANYRCQIFGATGLHELRLPSNYILGLDLLRFQGGPIGKFASYTSATILSITFIIGPQVYMFFEAASNLAKYGKFDLMSLVTLALVTISSICGMLTLKLSGDIHA